MTTPDYLFRKAFFMADRNDVHVLIGSKHNKWSHNSNDDSWYAENFTQGGASEDRASFHYPNLERWLLRATQRYERGESKYNPFSGKNLAFVLHDKETEGTATVMVSPNVMEYARKIFRTDKDFVVEMFDWDLETLSSEQLMAIFNDIHRSFVTCSFSDTLGIATPTTLVAQVKTPALPARGKTNKRRIKEGKNMKKNVVKINENTLKQIVAESVKNVLCEWWDEDGDWVGGVEDAEEEAQANRDMQNYNRRGSYSHEQVKIHEAQLRQIVAESVKKVLKEYHPDKVWRDTQAELFRKIQIEQDEMEISDCMSEIKPIFDKLEDKYGDLAYTAIMRLAAEMNPNPEY